VNAKRPPCPSRSPFPLGNDPDVGGRMERPRQYGGDVGLVNLLIHNPVHRLWMFDSGSRAKPNQCGDNLCGQLVERLRNHEKSVG
jgi:hypothetical protein